MATRQCGICETDCTGTRDIACDICNQWLHFACENLSEQEFIFLKKTSLSYMCYRCLYKDSTYNFDLALQRLSAATSQNLFDEAVHLERIFLRYEPPQVVSVDSVGLYHNLVQDQQATKLLGSRWSGPTPISVKGDGNCLFNAISVALFGHENVSSEIRLKIFFEMSDHAMFYERVHAKTQIPAISPTFALATKHCQQNGNWACAWTFHAASTVIARPIKSVYPVVNSPSDAYIRILNTTFKPRCSRSRQEISLMWSGGLGVSSFWRPSHFVPLIHMDKLSDTSICIDDFEQSPPLCKTSTPLSVPKPHPMLVVNHQTPRQPLHTRTLPTPVFYLHRTSHM